MDGSELARLGRRPCFDTGGRLRGVRQGLGRLDLWDGEGGRCAIHHQQARLDRGPMLGVGAGREGQAQDDPPTRGQGPHRRRVVEQACRDDGREPPAIGQTVERCVQMRLEPPERRIDQGDLERAGGGQHVLQMDGVMLGAGRMGE